MGQRGGYQPMKAVLVDFLLLPCTEWKHILVAAQWNGSTVPMQSAQHGDQVERVSGTLLWF